MFFFSFLFGRFYCSVICPFGILQDVILFFRRRFHTKTQSRNVTQANYPKTRYLILAVSLAMLAAGWAVAFKWLDPYSDFGKIVLSVFSVFGLFDLSDVKTNWCGIITGGVIFAVLVGLVIWKQRIFCTAICPVGTILGLCAKRGVFKLGISDKCKGCGKCERVCRAGCIDVAERTIDNERCVRCMDCVGACPGAGIRFAGSLGNNCSGVAHKIDNKLVSSVSRRGFVIGGLTTVAAFVLGKVLNPQRQMQACYKSANDAPCLNSQIDKTSYFIAPPGAGSPERFLSKCTSCQLCVAHCPGKVLKPADCLGKSKFSGNKNSIHLEFKIGQHCNYNCNRCGTVCPTGAIAKMDLAQKKRWRIGLAEITYDVCVTVADGTECGACAEQCPTGALQMVAGMNGARMPQLNPDLCIGCGSCEEACPVNPERAIIVKPVSIQVLADDPKEFFRKQRGGEENNNGTDDKEWLF
jgi:ferredoxin